MKIFGMGGIELVIILVVILLIFGPKNLPKLGNAFGKTVKNLRAGMNEGKAKDEPAAEEAADASEPVAEIEAEVEEDAAPAETQVAEADDTDLAEAAEQAVEQAEAAVDEAFAEAPKKVKRVVRKKVTLETPDEVVE